MADLPPLPPGFKLDQPSSAPSGDLPPLPPGFTLDAPQGQQQPAVSPSFGTAARGFARGLYAATGAELGNKPAETAAGLKRLGLGPENVKPIIDPQHPVTGELEDLFARKVPEFVGGLAAPMPGRIPGATQTWRGARDTDLMTGGTAGTRTDNAALQYIERTLARLPGGGPLVRAFDRLNTRYGDQANDIAFRLSGGRNISATGAGERIEQQLEARGAALRTESHQLYAAVDREVPPNTPIAINNYRQTLHTLTTPNQFAPAQTAGLIDPELMRLRQALDSDLARPSVAQGYLPYSALADIRTRIGQRLDGAGVLTTDRNTGQLRRLYGALTQDMETGASAVSPQARAAVDQARTRYAEISREREELEAVLQRNGGGEAIWNALMTTGQQRRWGGGATVINRVMAAIDQPSREYLAASALYQMGRATPGRQLAAAGQTFSADTFLTNWQRMSPDARQALFGNLPGNYANEVTQLADNVAALRRYAGLLPNNSNTAQIVIYTEGALAGLSAAMHLDWKAVAGLGGQVAATNVIARALTNPSTVRYLVEQTGRQLAYASRGFAGTADYSDQPKRPNLSDMQSPLQ